MQGLPVHDLVCDRSRRLASLRPDGEATELDEAFLVSHLAECVACRTYAEAVEASTAAIRATPPVEAPAFAIALRSRRRISMRALQGAAAAVIVATAGLSGLAGLSEQQRDGVARAAQRPAYLDSATYEQALINDLTRVHPYHGSRIAT
jgi:predicted anti-sigma-YlaC factor YlaD